MTDLFNPFILFIAAMAGGLAVFLFKTTDESKLKLLISFSGAYLLAICLLHLIPEIYEGNSTDIGMFILGGFFLQVMLEFLSGGIEHGHMHVHKKHLNVVPVAIMVSLCVHALTEGMPLGGEGLAHRHSTLVVGIVLHKMPIAFVLMAFMMQAKIAKPKAIAVLITFALMAPLGIMLGETVAAFMSIEELLAIVVGIFLHVSTTILFESTDNHRFNIHKIIIIIFGASLAFINL
ncbi:MAG: ZIP family metal transporter [Flavobacteriales bacterium]|nr:ZIP family metal transporter [Flavobacteriales bacterium]